MKLNQKSWFHSENLGLTLKIRNSLWIYWFHSKNPDLCFQKSRFFIYPCTCNKEQESAQSSPDNTKRTKTLNDFVQEKRKERHGFFKEKKIRNSSGTATCPRKSKVKASPNIRSEVLINVGLFESNDEGDIFLKRSSRIPVKVWKQYTAEEVLRTALMKHADNDQFFCSMDDYSLCYPDQKLVEFIPGTTESFTVEKCKEEFLFKFLCSYLATTAIRKIAKVMLVAIKERRK